MIGVFKRPNRRARAIKTATLAEPSLEAEAYQRVQLAEACAEASLRRLTCATQILMQRIAVLVVDDDPGVRLAIKIALRQHHVAAFSTRDAAVEAARCAPFDVALVDGVIGPGDMFLHDLRRVSPRMKILLYSGSPPPDAWEGPHVYKPATPQDLRAAIVAAVR